ncbi:MAG: hypothetical protein OEV33_00290 [Armatimonadota bacterium]|nr:hypothetical protein [Armatimonadota bacterium]
MSDIGKALEIIKLLRSGIELLEAWTKDEITDEDLDQETKEIAELIARRAERAEARKAEPAAGGD